MISQERIKKILLTKSTPLVEALKRMDDAGLQLIMVVDEIGRLIGLVTDGDVRRAILMGISLTESVCSVMNESFIAIKETEQTTPTEIMRTRHINHIPVLNEKGQVVDLVCGNEILNHALKCEDVPVVIMAGGRGTRLQPITKIVPKPLMAVGDQTMLEKIMDNFNAHGFCDFHLIVNYKKELIKSYISEITFPYRLTLIEEELYQGTAGGLSLLKGRINKTFILTNCDIITEVQYQRFIQWHEELCADMTILGVKKNIDIPYGVIRMNDEFFISEVEEKPTISNLIVSGVYIIEPHVIDMIEGGICTDMDKLVKMLISKGMNVACYPVDRGWHDMGQFKEYRSLLRHFGDLDV